MAFRSKPMFLKPFSVYLFYLFLVLSHYAAINLVRHDLLAQEDGEETASTIIERSTSVFINKEIIELLTVKDSSDNLLADTPITVTVDEANIASISLLNPVSEDKVVVEGSVLIAQTGENGQKAFLVKGVSSGSTQIKFEVTDKNNTSTVTEKLTVNVIELEAKIQVDKNIGEAPLTVQFFDRSIGKIDTRVWNFGDDDLVISTEKNPEHTFENSGIFNVTLEVTQTTTFGAVTDSAETFVCVSPGGAGLPGVIFGTVFDPVNNTPVNRVDVLLLTDAGERLQKTGRDGVYRFENVLPGTVIFTVCKTPFFECIVEEVDYDGGSLTKNFELTRREIPVE